MKRTQYEVAMFLCEDDRYELDMLVEANVSAMRAIQQRLTELPETEREKEAAMEEDRVRTLRERPAVSDAAGPAAGGEQPPPLYEGEILKPRHMRIIQVASYTSNHRRLAVCARAKRAKRVSLSVGYGVDCIPVVCGDKSGVSGGMCSDGVWGQLARNCGAHAARAGSDAARAAQAPAAQGHRVAQDATGHESHLVHRLP
jgi:hypothetical protein